MILKKIWAVICNLASSTTRKQNTSLQLQLAADRNIITKPQHIAETFNDYFTILAKDLNRSAAISRTNETSTQLHRRNQIAV